MHRPVLAGLSHPFLGMGPGPMGLGKLADVLTKIGKFDILLMYDVSIARLKLPFFFDI